ncbi:MAG: tetratricopeptide repeat protein [Phycisphaerales bacterium]|nr:MAG: tetratricopeptide repeat protein [Phycisphaerales bacterium]
MPRRKPASKGKAEIAKRSVGTVLLPMLVIFAGFTVYLNSFAGVFLFDDAVHILQNPRIQGLWPPWETLSGRRPVVDLLLAVNYAVGGFRVGGYHAVNVTIHILAGLTLFGIVRRTLLREQYPEHFGPASSWLAAVIALIWTVHPIQTQSVTYLIQRSESLTGLFYLLTLYCTIRGANSSRRPWWYAAAVALCALGMGSKAVMITAPVVVLLYDRAFLSKSFAEVLRRRWFLYLGLAATWGVLWACGVAHGVLSSSKRVATVGFSFKGVTPLEYAATQFGVLVEYLKLSLWPYPLCLDYTWPVERTPEGVVLPAILMVGLLTGAVWALFRKPWLGFLGAWFFLILAPTSSFIPIKDALFEHRVYLSLAAVVVLVVVGAHGVLRHVAVRLSPADSVRAFVSAALVVTSVLLLSYGTIRRNQSYHSEISMWRDVLARRPGNARAYEQLGTALVVAGNLHEAIAEYRNAVRVDPEFVSAHANLANALSQTGQFLQAVEHYLIVRQLDPYHVNASINLGHALDMLGRTEESIEAYREAARVDRKHAEPQVLARAHFNLGSALGRQGDLDGAVAEYRQALSFWPLYAKAHFSLGRALSLQGRYNEAVKHYNKTLDIDPQHDGARQALDDARRRQPRTSPD